MNILQTIHDGVYKYVFGCIVKVCSPQKCAKWIKKIHSRQQFGSLANQEKIYPIHPSRNARCKRRPRYNSDEREDKLKV